ncbi:zinc-dependent metalloprotease [Flavobacteriaceae bacterium]|nr:zinc-dependent metalloprotease [Flavobacteriaceae bacterium]
MFKTVTYSILFALLSFSSLLFSQEKKTLDSIISDFKVDKGLLSTYLKEDKLYFELQDSLLGKDLLMVTRYSQLPANFNTYTNAGSKSSQLLVRFSKRGDRILLTQHSYVNTAEVGSPISLSVEQNNFPPILGAFTIENKETDRYLIEVSDYFNSDSPGFNVIRKSFKKQFGLSSVDRKRSFIDHVKSFPRNTEIRHTLTYSASTPPRGNQAGTLSFQMNHSIIALPEDPMQIRYEDPRIGWFTLKQYNYSSAALKSEEVRLIRRWRLVPSDMEAYKNGELVAPVKPIVYYLDPATPLKWRPYFKQGIEDWNTAFEKAGFKNAILAKDPPSKEENPDFSPEDSRYSTVRYVASTTRNATGPSVSDPRTGEIIESDIIWYHNHLRSYRNRYLIETGAANPKARTLNTPEEEIGEMMRRVISHEVGHALGLPHNMKASSAYPVDSLRSGNFTQKMGIATTIMDYARYNYIAQPGDENIRFVRQLGPYDDYAIEWGYRYFPEKTSETKKVSLRKMVDEKSMNPMYMFGYNQYDPDSQTENIGDDPIKASSYGLSNLKIVAQNLDEWTTSEGQSYDDLQELYKEMIGVYRSYVYHVIRLIGGVNETLMNKGQDDTPYKNVPAAKQRRALEFLERNLWITQNWLMDKNLLSKLEDHNALKNTQALQRAALNRVLSRKQLNRMLSNQTSLVGQGLDPDELIAHLFKTLFESQYPLDNSFMALQVRFTNHLIELTLDEKLNPRVEATVAATLHEIHKNVKKKQKRGSQILQNHFKFLVNQTATY